MPKSQAQAPSRAPSSSQSQAPDAATDFGSNADQAQASSEEQEELSPQQKAAELVAKLGTNIGKNPLREEYMATVAAMSSEIQPMRDAGKTDEDIARTLHQRRIDIGKQYKALTPEPLRDYIFEVNTDRYGNEYGPSVEYLLKKYEGDWSKIIEGACRPNGSVDTLLARFGDWLTKQDPAKLNAYHAAWCT